MIDKTIVQKQREFFELVRQNEYLENKSAEEIRDYIIGIQKNAVDILNALDLDPSKEGNYYAENRKRIEIIDGIIDIFKYLLNISFASEVSIRDLERNFYQKSDLVAQKYRQRLFLKNEVHCHNKMFVIDIDGILADIVKAYQFFFKLNWNDFCSWRDKHIDSYNDLKEMYRLSGFKSHMPVVEGAKELLMYCKSKGIVSLLSNRPVLKYPIIYQQTVRWLRSTGMLGFVDMIHFTDLGEKKYFFNRFVNKKIYFIEDNVYNLKGMENRENVTSILLRNETNVHEKDINDKIKQVNSLQECIDFLQNEENKNI